MSLADRIEWTLPAGWQNQLPPNKLVTDTEKMRFVVQLGRWNIDQQTGGPFAAAVFCRETHELISIGVNRVIPLHCSLAHAEAVAISLAQQKTMSHDLSLVGAGRFELFASGQPCVQCFGMVWWSGLTRMVISARATDIEELTGFHEGPLPENWPALLASRSPLPSVEVVTDIERTAGRELLRLYSAQGGANYSPGQAT